MNTSVTFYTSSILANTPVISYTPQDAASNPNNVIYPNLNTFWLCPKTASNPYLVYDTHPQDEAAYNAGRGETSGSWDSMSLWLKSYDTPMTDILLNVYNGFSGSGINTEALVTGVSWAHEDGPLFVFDFDTPSWKRYIRLSIVAPTMGAEVSYMGIHNKRTIQTTPKYPLEWIAEYYNTSVVMNGGNEYVSPQALNCTYSATQRYTFISIANRDAHRNVFHDSKGKAYPLVYQEGTTMAEARLCRLMSNKLGEKVRDHETYDATISFKTLPYIKDGDNF